MSAEAAVNDRIKGRVSAAGLQGNTLQTVTCKMHVEHYRYQNEHVSAPHFCGAFFIRGISAGRFPCAYMDRRLYQNGQKQLPEVYEEEET